MLMVVGLFSTVLLFIPLIRKLDFHLQSYALEANYKSFSCMISVACSLRILIEIILDIIYVPYPLGFKDTSSCAV
jgi:hypothetical protein